MGWNPILGEIRNRGMIEDLVKYGSYMFRVSKLSYFNSAMLLIQKPGLGFAGSPALYERYGFGIRPEARPLLILKPFAPVDLYYEVCDTYPLYPKASLPWWMLGDIERQPVAYPLFKVEEALARHGVYYGERDFGMRLRGEMQYVTHPVVARYMVKKGSVYEKRAYETHYAMVVNRADSDGDKVATIFHEIGHLLCGHLPVDEEIQKTEKFKCKVPERCGLLSYADMECEAEMTCEMIAKALGFPYKAERYIRDICGDEEAKYDFSAVCTAADRFLSWLTA